MIGNEVRINGSSCLGRICLAASLLAYNPSVNGIFGID